MTTVFQASIVLVALLGLASHGAAALVAPHASVAPRSVAVRNAQPRLSALASESEVVSFRFDESGKAILINEGVLGGIVVPTLQTFKAATITKLAALPSINVVPARTCLLYTSPSPRDS